VRRKRIGAKWVGRLIVLSVAIKTSLPQQKAHSGCANEM